MQLVVTDSIRKALVMAASDETTAIIASMTPLSDTDMNSTSICSKWTLSATAESVPHSLVWLACDKLGKAYPGTARKPHRFVCPKPREITPEYTAFMNKVKTKLENQEYEQMIRKIPGGKAGDESSGLAYDISELRKVSSQMMSLVNILFSMVAVFAALFVFSEHVWNDPGLRVLFGLFGALVVGFAEGMVLLP
ncbi:hypothetical protein BASA61_002122 [Batrachochytrium salamandrivorans]|nr:hypothetical protein BASA61_002122 [Batrachochytrium salamandrivorans]